MITNDDAVRRKHAYLQRHPGAEFWPATGRQPRWRASLDGGDVDVWANDLHQLLNRLNMGGRDFPGDLAWVGLPWRADGRHVYAHASDGDTLIGVMASMEAAEGACAEHHAILAARNGHMAPVHPPAAAGKAGV